MHNMSWKYRLGSILVSLLTLFLFWSPFALHLNSFWGIEFDGVGMERIVANFDGLNFLAAAKTNYDPHLLETRYADILAGRKNVYFAAHYPGFPGLIKLFDLGLDGPNALLMSIVAGNILLAWGLFEFCLLVTANPKKSLVMTTVALLLPARMLADRAVGSNEPLFMFLVLMSLVANARKQHWVSALLGTGAVLTRSPGILLFAAYAIKIASEKSNVRSKIKSILPYLLIPAALLALWGFYGYRFGSFWAYFQVGGNINLYWPFSVFATGMDWVSGIWLEDIIYLLVLLTWGVKMYWDRNSWSPTALFGIIYLGLGMCVAHRDLGRYMLPITPLAIAGLSYNWESKLTRWVIPVILVPVFLFGWQFVLNNYQLVTDWSRFL